MYLGQVRQRERSDYAWHGACGLERNPLDPSMGVHGADYGNVQQSRQVDVTGVLAHACEQRAVLAAEERGADQARHQRHAHHNTIGRCTQLVSA